MGIDLQDGRTGQQALDRVAPTVARSIPHLAGPPTGHLVPRRWVHHHCAHRQRCRSNAGQCRLGGRPIEHRGLIAIDWTATRLPEAPAQRLERGQRESHGQSQRRAAEADRHCPPLGSITVVGLSLPAGAAAAPGPVDPRRPDGRARQSDNRRRTDGTSRTEEHQAGPRPATDGQQERTRAQRRHTRRPLLRALIRPAHRVGRRAGKRCGLLEVLAGRPRRPQPPAARPHTDIRAPEAGHVRARPREGVLRRRAGDPEEVLT